MPIRIYALAKELKVDSKDLVDICVKAGVTGKGSALASLEDDELAKVKAYLAGPKKPAGRAESGGASPISSRGTVDTGPISREDYIPPPASLGKIKVLDSRPKKPAAPAPAAPAGSSTAVAAPSDEAADAPVSDEQPAETTPAVDEQPSIAPPPAPEPEPESVEEETPEIVAQQPAAAEPVAPPRPTPPAPPPLHPMQPIRPTPVSRSVPMLPSQPSKTSGPRVPLPPKSRTPVINLAKMPEVKQPPPTASGPAERAQRPDIRLPKDVIRGAKAGARPPLGQIVQSHAAQQSTARGKTDSPSTSRVGAGRPGAPKKPGDPPTVSAPLSKAAAANRKKGKPGDPPEGEKDLAAMAGSRVDRTKSRTKAKIVKVKADGTIELEDDDSSRRRGRRLVRRGSSVNTAAPRKDKVEIELPCSVRAFSEASGVGAGQILKTLMKMGQMVNINAPLSQELAEAIALELGLDIELKSRESLESSVLTELDEQEDDPADLVARPPIVTFLGHVDHGKTSLLDYLIGINVAAKEAGGITQHIRAYQIEKDGRKISFVDTPGHEAFTEMRARGANVTDIAVLVVAADDGVMPQTEEAISHAKAAGVPIVVALNKMDLPGANADRVLQQLAAQGLMPSEWSGDVEVVRCSAITGKGMDELLETLLVTADLHEYVANPNRAASGTCLEAEQQSGRGVVAKIIVKNGTLKVGDIVVCGPAHGRIKAMYDTLKPNVQVKKAGPAMPVNITGLDIAPNAGDSFHVLDDIAKAREIAASRADTSRAQSLSGQTMKVSFDQFQKMLSEGRVGEKVEVVELNLIIRADVRGSIEAILKELGKLEHPEVKVKILQASVGGITVADVTLAHASNAVIVGFNVIPDEAARSLAEQRLVEIRRYDIIYKVADDIKSMLEGRLKPEERIIDLGQAIVKQVFAISRIGVVAGCYVSRGTIERGVRMRVFRDGRQIGDYAIDSLRREKDDTKEVPRGMECGIRLAGFNDVKKDDILEAYKIQEVARTL